MKSVWSQQMGCAHAKVKDKNPHKVKHSENCGRKRISIQIWQSVRTNQLNLLEHRQSAQVRGCYIQALVHLPISSSFSYLLLQKGNAISLIKWIYTSPSVPGTFPTHLKTLLSTSVSLEALTTEQAQKSRDPLDNTVPRSKITFPLAFPHLSKRLCFLSATVLNWELMFRGFLMAAPGTLPEFLLLKTSGPSSLCSLIPDKSPGTGFVRQSSAIAISWITHLDNSVKITCLLFSFYSNNIFKAHKLSKRITLIMTLNVRPQFSLPYPPYKKSCLLISLFSLSCDQPMDQFLKDTQLNPSFQIKMSCSIMFRRSSSTQHQLICLYQLVHNPLKKKRNEMSIWQGLHFQIIMSALINC